jgi:hypothetical protein
MEVFMLLYKFRDLKKIDRIFDILENKQLYCSSYDDLNDPFEGEYNYYYGDSTCGVGVCGEAECGSDGNHYNTLNNCNLGICSLSSKNDDVRMWSFYADGHKGICIEIEWDDDKKQDIYPVTYDLDPKKVTHENLNDEVIKRILSRKSSHWNYESESRIISTLGKYNINGSIKSIIIGCRTDENEKKLLKKIAPNIPFHYAKIRYGYKMHITSET